MKFDNSQRAYSRAKAVIPGGVNSPARAFGGVGGQPIFMDRGDGPFLYDIDGNRYIDYIGSWGPFILGHRHPAVVEAIIKALERSTSFGAPCELESALAEKIVAAVPGIEMVRMVSSGTEAAMSAVRLARGYTGRNKIVKVAGCYHGHVDSLLVQAGSSATTLGVPTSPGIPAGATADTIIVEFNDVAAVQEIFAAQADQIAAVLLEPVAGNMGLVVPKPGYLEALRDITRKHGALLVFDEVMTGFRLAYGGVQELFGIVPDLTILGKIVGGGLPVGAFGGRAEIMQCVSPAGPVFQAGTLSGNPLAMAAGLATLTVLERERPYKRLAELTKRLIDGIDRAAKAAGWPHTIAQIGSMATLFFGEAKIENYAHARKCDASRFGRYFWKSIERGVYWPCSQFEAFFVSTSHTEELIDETIAAASWALQNCG